MLDEYAFLVIETQQEAETEKALQKAVQKHMKTAGKWAELLKVEPYQQTLLQCFGVIYETTPITFITCHITFI